MLEHRRYPRIEFDRRAWCEHPSLTLYLSVTNVSRTGMFLQTGAAFLPGETLKIALDSEDEETPVVAEAEIVWTGRSVRGSWGCGVRLKNFSSGEDQYRAMLREKGGG